VSEYGFTPTPKRRRYHLTEAYFVAVNFYTKLTAVRLRIAKQKVNNKSKSFFKKLLQRLALGFASSPFHLTLGKPKEPL